MVTFIRTYYFSRNPGPDPFYVELSRPFGGRFFKYALENSFALESRCKSTSIAVVRLNKIATKAEMGTN